MANNTGRWREHFANAFLTQNSTTHRIVESHGGSLRVETTLGAGTTFRIRLPQAEELK